MKIDGGLIKEKRRKLNLKQYELGRLIGYKGSDSSIQRLMSRVEIGKSKKLPYYKYLRLCYVLDIDPFDLIIEEQGDFPELEGVVF